MIHDEIQIDKAYTFSDKIYVSAIQIIPDSATYTITNKSSTSVQSGTASIDSDGTITYELTADNNSTIDINYKRVTSYVYNSITTEIAHLFDVVKQPIVNQITDTDLYNYLPILRSLITEIQGETDSIGSLSSIQDDRIKSDDRDFTGGKIEIYISDEIIHYADITASNKSVGTVSFSPSYSSTITSDIKYTLRSSYKTRIDTAFQDHVRPTLRKRIGNILSMSGFIDSDVVNKLIIYKAIELICFPNIEVAEDVWDIRYLDFKEKYDCAITAFNESYDYNEDGNISDSEAKSSFGFSTRRVAR